MFELPGTPITEMSGLDASAVREALDSHPSVNLKPFKKMSQRNFGVLDSLLNIPEAELVL
jgi:hypothetical protein